MAIPKDNVPSLQSMGPIESLNSLKIGGRENAENNGNTLFSQLPEGWNSKTTEKSPEKPAAIPTPEMIPAAATFAPGVIREANKPNLSAQPEAIPAVNATSAAAVPQTKNEHTGTVAEKAFNTAKDSVTEKVAIQVRDFLPVIPILTGKDIEIPNADDHAQYREIADSLIKDRKFTARTKNGENVTITIEELDKSLDSNSKKQLKENYGAESLNEIIPKDQTRDAIAKAVSKGVEENTGGFINLLMGFVKWVFSGFEGGFDGLQKSIAGTTADSVAVAVGKNLASANVSMNLGLSNENMREISDNVHSAVLKEAKVSDPNAKEPVTLASPRKEAQQPVVQNDVEKTAPAPQKTTEKAEANTVDGAGKASTEKAAEKTEEKGKTKEEKASTPVSHSKTEGKSEANITAKKEVPKAKSTGTKEKETVKEEGKKLVEKPTEQKSEDVKEANSLRNTAIKITINSMTQNGTKQVSKEAIRDAASVVNVVLHENKDLLKNGKYEALSNKITDALLANEKTGARLRAEIKEINENIPDKGIDIAIRNGVPATPFSPKIIGLKETVRTQLEANSGNLQQAIIKDEAAERMNKARTTASLEGINLQKFGVNATGNATTLAMRAQPNSAAGAGLV